MKKKFRKITIISIVGAMIPILLIGISYLKTDTLDRSVTPLEELTKISVSSEGTPSKEQIEKTGKLLISKYIASTYGNQDREINEKIVEEIFVEPNTGYDSMNNILENQPLLYNIGLSFYNIDISTEDSTSYFFRSNVDIKANSKVGEPSTVATFIFHVTIVQENSTLKIKKISHYNIGHERL